MILFLILIFAGITDPVFAQNPITKLQSTAVIIPGGEGGIGFDDLLYSSSLQKVLVPAGHTGKVYLIDPGTFEMNSIGGFSSSAQFQKETLSVIKVSDQGKLSLLAQAPAAPRAHCVVSDDQNNIWVCDPTHGQLLRYKDSL